jgi:hypothetical protein
VCQARQVDEPIVRFCLFTLLKHGVVGATRSPTSSEASARAGAPAFAADLSCR